MLQSEASWPYSKVGAMESDMSFITARRYLVELWEKLQISNAKRS